MAQLMVMVTLVLLGLTTAFAGEKEAAAESAALDA
jgi:hypothetical protein